MRVERVLFNPLVAVVVVLLLAVPVALVGLAGLEEEEVVAAAAMAALLLGVFLPVVGTAGFLFGVDADMFYELLRDGGERSMRRSNEGAR